MDPFTDEPVLNISCDVHRADRTASPTTADPRGIAKRAEAYLKSTGLGDVAYFGPEPEFFIFDGVTWNVDMSGCFVKIKSEEAPWSTGIDYESGNMGAPRAGQGRLLPGAAGRHAAGHPQRHVPRARAAGRRGRSAPPRGRGARARTRSARSFAPLVQRADWMQILKYTVWNVAHSYGKTATFMPKPIVGDNGSGMHVHQSVWKGGKNLFAGNGYAGLSDFALYYIGGIIKHAKALNAITNPGTNSYKRLVPGFEAPINLAYSARNRSAVVPHSATSPARRRAASRCASRIRPRTRTSRSRRC